MPGYKYSLFEFQRDFNDAWTDICSRGRQPVLCGGSGMYIESVTGRYGMVNVPHNYPLRSELEAKSDTELISILASKKELHNVSDTSSRKRLVRAIEIAMYTASAGKGLPELPEFDNCILGIEIDRDQRRENITRRLDERIEEGLEDEVRELLGRGISPEDLIFYGLEYKYVTLYVTGRMSFDDMKRKLVTAIHQFAKRQMTWFRKMERTGYKINWINADLPMEEKVDLAIRITGRHTEC
jgi:tRNA dimethylallyltransferase